MVNLNNLIKKYAEKLTKDDIRNFALKENVNITNNEVNIIYDSIKNDTDTLLSKDALSYINKFKPLLSDEVYNKIIEKYNKYKDFIN